MSEDTQIYPGPGPDRAALRVLVVLGAGTEGALIQANRAVLAYALRALLHALSSTLPGTGRVAVTVDSTGDGVLVVLAVDAGRTRVGDLHRGLTQVFGTGADECRFDQALCLRLLSCEGAAIDVREPAEGRGVVSLRFSPWADRHAIAPTPRRHVATPGRRITGSASCGGAPATTRACPAAMRLPAAGYPAPGGRTVG